jgi:hypothetical protein
MAGCPKDFLTQCATHDHGICESCEPSIYLNASSHRYSLKCDVARQDAKDFTLYSFFSFSAVTFLPPGAALCWSESARSQAGGGWACRQCPGHEGMTGEGRGCQCGVKERWERSDLVWEGQVGALVTRKTSDSRGVTAAPECRDWITES